MDHNEAVQQKATERYLLNELDPGQREQFEEHFFDCQDCALDVRAAAMFIDGVKVIGAKREELVPAYVPKPQVQVPWWSTWLSPAFGTAALALLLLVGYQNTVTLPRLTKLANSPRLLASVAVNLSTYNATPTPTPVRDGEPFIMNVIVTPESRFSSYRADLHNPAGEVESSLPIPASTDDTWPIVVPGKNRQSGTYNLTVVGITADGKDHEVGHGSFDLQVQK